MFAAPTISWIFPAGGRRGATVVAEVHGSGLKEVSGFYSSGMGVAAEVVPIPEPKKGDSKPQDFDSVRTLRITVAPDAPLGGQEIRVFDHTGLSNHKIFQVGQWAEAVETEPNDSLDGLKPMPVPVTVNGQIRNGSDQDAFQFSAKAGEQITCEVHSERLISSFDDSWLKGFLEILDASGKVLADNSGRFHWDPVIHFTAPNDGDYIARFRDLLWRGNPGAVYRLTIGPVPYADALFPPGGRRGSAVQAALIGSNLGQQPTQKITLTTDDPAGRQEVRFPAPNGLTNALVFQASDGPELLEREPNDRDPLAQPVSPTATLNGIIQRPKDRDAFRFHANAHQRLVFEIYAYRAGSPLDSYLTLRDSKGQILDENDDSRDRDSLMERTFKEAGDFYIEVRDADERGGADYTYRLRVGSPVPDFRLAATPDRVAVPAGGAARIDVKISREWDFNEAVALSVEGLPPGWRASSPVIPKGGDHAFLTVESPTTTGPGGAVPSRLRIVGTAHLDGRTLRRTAMAEETYNLQGTAYQRQVIGPISVATDPTAALVQPEAAEVALTAGGQAALRVKIVRAPGEKGTVTLSLGELPDGVKAEPVVLNADQDEGVFTVVAPEEASGAERDVLVTATIKSADGKESAAISRAVSLHLSETPGFTLTVEPGEVALGPGKSAELKVKATRRGGFDGPITLQVAGLPEGVTASAAEVKASEGEAKVTLKAQEKLPADSAGKATDIRVEGIGTIAGEKRTRRTGAVKLAVGK